MEEMLTRPL